MRTGTIAFLIGVVIFLHVSALPPQWVLLSLAVAILALLILPKSQTLTSTTWAILCAMICGFLWAFIRADIILSDGLDRMSKK
jgi:drug/metabolite transporter (DMT)-like permease